MTQETYKIGHTLATVINQGSLVNESETMSLFFLCFYQTPPLSILYQRKLLCKAVYTLYSFSRTFLYRIFLHPMYILQLCINFFHPSHVIKPFNIKICLHGRCDQIAGANQFRIGTYITPRLVGVSVLNQDVDPRYPSFINFNFTLSYSPSTLGLTASNVLINLCLCC